MPRFCKVCKGEFPTAAKLAEHLKVSDCSNHISTIKCPYCDRDDFVDEDSLNRHLSQNRQCSRADIEATDKLSILAPDPSYTKHLKDGGVPDKTIDHTHVSYMDMLTPLEGNLVNVANAMAIQAVHKMHRSLHPDPSSMTFIITIGKEFNAEGGVERQLKTLDKLMSSSVHIQIFQNESFGESEQEIPNPEVENVSVLSDSSTLEAVGDVDASLDPPPTVEFDVGIDDNSASDHDIEAQVNNNQFLAGMENIPILKEFHGGSPKLDCLAELYIMLDKRGVANLLFDEFAEWAWLHGPSFGRTPPMKRKTVVEKVFRHVRGDSYRQFMAPKQKVLKLSTGRHVAVSYFPIEQMIQDLLCNSTLMRVDHLPIADVNNPLNDDNHQMTSFGDVNSGSWWTTARKHECKGDRDMLWPLMMFIVGMKVDNMSGKLKLEPISFTFSRFHRWVRNQDNAWRTWAYMEEVKQPLVPLTNEDDNVSQTAKERLQEYHDILTFLLQDLKKIQTDGFPWILDLGEGRKYNVVLKMPLQFVIGDCDGRFKGHTMNIKGLCRDCDVPTQHGDDVNWLCNYFEEEFFQQLSEEELRRISFHKIVNGFYGLSSGGCPQGIWGLFNPEMLHVFKSGQSEWISDGYTFTLSTKAMQLTNRASSFLVLANEQGTIRSVILQHWNIS